SVPYTLRGFEVDARFNTSTVEIFHQGKRVASHARSFLKGRHTTLQEHLPPSHREYREWPPSRLIAWGATIGPSTEEVVETILSAGAYPVQGYRRCLGILRLGKKYGEARLESACERALALRALSYKSIESILKTGSEKLPLRKKATAPELPLFHDNIRGPGYYH
ncbi:MAG TPA: IS21 family transposase, partial [Candidatus Deferrimicrobium sp.]